MNIEFILCAAAPITLILAALGLLLYAFGGPLLTEFTAWLNS